MSSTPKQPLSARANGTLNGSAMAGAGKRPFASPSTSAKASKARSNRSILTFFKKVETPAESGEARSDVESDSLFLGDAAPLEGLPRVRSATPEGLGGDMGWPDETFGEENTAENTEENTEEKYNEDTKAVKRRRTDADEHRDGRVDAMKQTRKSTRGSSASTPRLPVGPFFEESESENEEPEGILGLDPVKPGEGVQENVPGDVESKQEEVYGLQEEKNGPQDSSKALAEKMPTLKREATSIPGDDGSVGGEGPEEDYVDDEFAHGEEFIERRWMEEQRRLELAENGFEDDLLAEADTEELPPGYSAAACPLCNADLSGISEGDAQLHVNHCLDGNPIPLPERKHADPETKAILTPNRFQRPPRPPKPAQANPFSAAAGKDGSSSAFSKLMSSHAEDAAWATAAAAENSARGKPAYQRVCPFYKILPGFQICVDAFRYGAVEGCQAYFLSHFHSDHYVGLTSTWQHGPIYCSHVTANLVRQQLRVDPQYVVDVEFEQKMEVPGTNGVQVTMIPANHCPGSSLFLFEKVVGRGKNPKMQRVLHCGDFRACPEHVRHPLLRPDIVDAVSGKAVGQQKIDVCYLDTTYLNPRYAFPCQQEVIQACADMCVSLRKERRDDNDRWENMKRERAGSGMARFVRTDSAPSLKEEEEEDAEAMKVDEKSGGKSRGRLLVVVGTYSIGKERICLGIARALDSKIYAPPPKRRICACLEDPELNARLTSDPYAAQVHMTPLFEIRAETLAEYLAAYKPHFSRVVGFRPSGWNYRPPNSRFVESPAVQTVLHSAGWRSSYSMTELEPQRGSTREASCFGVPYSEHSSFRELTMFCCALRIDKVIPTVNVGSAKSRERMKAWFERWAVEKRKNGLFAVPEAAGTW